MALLGVRLQLGLEGRELGKRRIGVGLLLALAARGVVAEILLLAPILGEMRPLATRPFGTLAARTIRPIALPVGTMLATRHALGPLTALAAVATKFTRWAAPPATMLLCGLFHRRARFDGGRFGIGVRRNGALRRSTLRRCRRYALRRPLALACVLPAGRTSRGTPLVATAAGSPDIDQFRLARNRGCRRRFGR